MPEHDWDATLRRLRAAHATPPTTPPSMRELRDTFAPAGIRHRVPDDVEVTDVQNADVTGQWFRCPGADTTRAVLYLHGGGYALGSPTSHGELIARIARASGMGVLALDYRLAPEHPAPAALDDARVAWTWLRQSTGLEPSSIGVVGDSAGGGLALALLLTTRDDHGEQPGAAALMSPWTDLTQSGKSMTTCVAEDPLLTPGLLAHLAEDYLAGADPHDPLASPLFADLTGLAPLLVQVGTAEILLSDSERLAVAARRAGVELTLHVEPGAPHVYPSMVGDEPAHAATDMIGAFLRERLDTSPRHRTRG
jgi:monoterpene epsilon-lactone hydrolase